MILYDGSFTSQSQYAVSQFLRHEESKAKEIVYMRFNRRKEAMGFRTEQNTQCAEGYNIMIGRYRSSFALIHKNDPCLYF